MDIGKTFLDGLTGVATGIVGGPIGMVAGLLTGVAPDLLGLFAPHLAGPQGAAVAQAIVDVVSAATGAPTPTAASVAGLSPDARAQLQVQLATIAVQAEAGRQADAASARAAELATWQAQLADVAGARAQTIALAGMKSNIAWAAPVVSVTVLLTFGAMIAMLFIRPIPPGSEALANVMLGSLATMASGVVAYWIGSSAGSKQKDDTIQQGQAALANSTPIR